LSGRKTFAIYTTFDPNLDGLRTVTRALGALRDEVLFVGGATAGLLITDPAAVSIRPADDVDCVVGVASTAAYHAFERRLLVQSLSPDPAVIFRYRIEGGPRRVSLSFDAPGES
jgi:hypothetical protein